MADDDTLTGAAGADTFVFGLDNGNDIVTNFTNGEDVIDLTQFPTIGSFSDLTITSDADGVTIDLTAHGGGTILLQGFDINDIDAADFVFPKVGTDGDDYIVGSQDSETIYGGEGHDWLFGGQGSDTIYGGEGRDDLSGGEGDDVLYGGEGDDTLEGGANNDTLYGGEGKDYLFGGEGSDILYGGDGRDNLYGGDGDDTLYGGTEGGDLLNPMFLSKLEGGKGNDTIYGGEGHEIITGDDGNDFLYGGTGNDNIYGGSGSDVIEGGEGGDNLRGGEGADTFVFAAGHGNDRIGDFTNGEDQIDLTQITGITAFGDLSITADGTTAVIDLSDYGGGEIRLDNVAVADLDAEDFQFYEPPTDSGVDGM